MRKRLEGDRFEIERKKTGPERRMGAQAYARARSYQIASGGGGLPMTHKLHAIRLAFSGSINPS